MAKQNRLWGAIKHFLGGLVAGSIIGVGLKEILSVSGMTDVAASEDAFAGGGALCIGVLAVVIYIVKSATNGAVRFERVETSMSSTTPPDVDLAAVDQEVSELKRRRRLSRRRAMLFTCIGLLIELPGMCVMILEENDPSGSPNLRIAVVLAMFVGRMLTTVGAVYSARARGRFFLFATWVLLLGVIGFAFILPLRDRIQDRIDSLE